MAAVIQSAAAGQPVEFRDEAGFAPLDEEAGRSTCGQRPWQGFCAISETAAAASPPPPVIPTSPSATPRMAAILRKKGAQLVRENSDKLNEPRGREGGHENPALVP